MLLYPRQRNESALAEIRNLLTKNLLANEERGKEATGVAIIQKDGEAFIEKQPVSASDFVDSERYAKLLEKIDSNTVVILGHTRRPTKGDVLCHHNNHPIVTGAILGIHNGQVENDEQQFAECGCTRTGEVDSEIIFRYIERYSRDGITEKTLPKVQSKLQLLKGQLTFLSCDRRTPHKLLVAKHLNPLSLYYDDELSTLIFSSRYVFLRKYYGTKAIQQNVKGEHLYLFDATTLEAYEGKPVYQMALGRTAVKNPLEYECYKNTLKDYPFEAKFAV
ncbi:Glucosamine 6-phosphate synthetase contains amidotransferase and phosphosugar isomerase domains-like protein [Chloroherpeton thalassium ATCC 35110]|uniref:glutamine--fructose-6-phosphate transaminase (isomerizing) n=1 Tax=Chloroherpeton thalassium (strain ATCC 35110 / GB-78) TaxID=517418 RepID=B3QU66_CHLT3|nr:glucosamine 6-phosphate synthetase [Chloroherpeton thalassium]ACF12864.1 Glucosamine 6-phosphate synthetase contains amidotransferase and phosphosugar isomerase domains-like protein [Chloroherpeton thalassium ATCC 35110]